MTGRPESTRLGGALRTLGHLLRSLLTARNGAVAVYVGLTVPLFVGAAGLAVDISSWYRTRRTVQTGVDAAAYAAALDIARQGLDQPPDLVAAQAVADDVAGRNGLATPVTLNVPPLSGVAAGDPRSVEVIATQPGAVHFSGLFLDAPPTITARATARAVVSDACIWSLHPTARAAFSISGSAQVDLGCGVVVNSNHAEAALEQTGTSCLTSTSVAVHGGYSGTCVTPEPEVFTPDYGDPLSGLTPPIYGACDHPSTVTVDSAMARDYGGGPVPLGPGVYCGGIAVQANQTVVFAPGLYVLKGGQFYVAGNAHVSNTENAWGGVTFYLTGTGGNYAYLTFQSGADITLTPMTTGSLANVLFFQDPNAPASGTNRVAGGVNMDLTGIIYIPNQLVEFTGGSTADESDVLLVSSKVVFTGNTYLNADYARSLLPQMYHARLVE